MHKSFHRLHQILNNGSVCIPTPFPTLPFPPIPGLITAFIWVLLLILRWGLHSVPLTATHCNTLQHAATCGNMLQHVATHCNKLQHTASHTVAHSGGIVHFETGRPFRATHCNTLQHIATQSNTHYCKFW